jgi:hypothetical protein
VVPGDRLRLEITLGKRRAPLALAQATAYVGDQIVAEAELVLGLRPDKTEIDSSAVVHPRAQIGEGTTIGPHATIGANVTIGANCKIGASAVIDGWTDIGDETEIYPFASIGQVRRTWFRGEETRLVIGRRNIFRVRDRPPRRGGGVTTTLIATTCTSPTTAMSATTPSSETWRLSAGVEDCANISADPACTSSAGSAATGSSAALGRHARRSHARSAPPGAHLVIIGLMRRGSPGSNARSHSCSRS